MNGVHELVASLEGACHQATHHASFSSDARYGDDAALGALWVHDVLKHFGLSALEGVSIHPTVMMLDIVMR